MTAQLRRDRPLRSGLLRLPGRGPPGQGRSESSRGAYQADNLIAAGRGRLDSGRWKTMLRIDPCGEADYSGNLTSVCDRDYEHRDPVPFPEILAASDA